MDSSSINIIELDNRDDLVKQKIAVYDKWLQVYPNASWDDVINALETAEENTIAKQLREKYRAAIQPEPLPTQKKQTSAQSSDPTVIPPNDLRLQSTVPEEVTVSEDIVSELDILQRSFVGLTGDVKMGVERQLENGTELKLLTRDLQEERAFPIPSLRSVTTSDELFEAIHPHYNFLNCYLIVSIALHLSGAIAEKATEYKEKVFKFMKTTKIRFLQNTLKRYSRMFRERSNSTAVVEIVVTTGWDKQNLWLVKNLIETLFPVKHCDELPWYNIVPGSVVMTFIALEHMTSSLIESSRKKTEFMRLIGVISLKIGDKLVWSGTQKLCSLEENLIQATLANNFEVVQFLLQHTQVKINTKNATDTLQPIFRTTTNSGDYFWNKLKLERKFKYIYTTYTFLISDIETELSNQHKKPLATGHRHQHRHENFLISEMSLHLSSNYDKFSKPLSQRIHHYRQSLDLLKKQALVTSFAEFLEQYFPLPFPNSSEVIITLQGVWSTSSVWYVEQLAQVLFTPTLFHKLQWFRVNNHEIEDESRLKVVLLASNEIANDLVEKCLNYKKSSLLGVISVRVDDTVVIKNDYSNGYTFNDAVELAKEVNDSELLDLLLQTNQMPVVQNKVKKIVSSFDGNNNHFFLPELDSTALMIACCNDSSQLVQLLLDHNADPNIQNGRGITALMYSTGNNKIFQILIDHKADMNAQSFTNETVLYFACLVGNAKVVKNLLARNFHKLMYIANNDGAVPLGIASQHGYNHVARMLLKAKLDPNIQDSKGWTALKVASKYDHIEVVESLLEKGADPDIQDKEGWTALHSASRYGRTKIVKMLLQSKADPNIQNNSGWTALKLASRYGHTIVVRMLLQAKANPNIQDNGGRTALKSASDYGHIEIVGKLLQAKVDSSIQDNEGWTALHSASFEGHTKIVEMLLQAKADPNIEDNNGWTAFLVANTIGHAKVVALLCGSAVKCTEC